MTSRNDWRARMNEVLDANPEENDSLDPTDSWKAIPRRTEVIANRSKHRLYRRHKDPDMLSTKNAYNVMMIKLPTKVNAERLKKQTTNDSPTENDAGSAPNSSTPDNIVTSSTTLEETSALNFTDFVRLNNKTNIKITSTPYVVRHTAAANQLPTNDQILPPEVACTPKIPLLRTSFLHGNDDSYTTPRSSRVSVNLINNSQLVSQTLRDAERELHLNIIPKNNKSSNGAQIGSAIVSSTVNSRENVLTSDEDSEEQRIFRKPLEKILFPKPQILSTSSQNTITNKMGSQTHALQNEGQLSTVQPSNSIQNAKRKQESRHEVGVSTKEYMELMNTRTSNAQQSENSTASSTRRKLYRKGDSIHADEGVDPNTFTSQKVSEDVFDQLRSEQPVTSHVKGISPLSTRKEETVSVQLFNEKVNPLDDSSDEMNELESEVVVPPNKERIYTRSPNKFERRLRSIQSKSPINRGQNGSETKEIIQPKKVVNQKHFSLTSKKRAAFSKQSRMHSEPNSSELILVNPLSTEMTSQKLPSIRASVDNEDDNFQPIDIDHLPYDEVNVAQISNENKQSPFPSNNLCVESEQDNFETSDIQLSNEVDVEKNKSQKLQVLSKHVMHTEQNGSKTKRVGKSGVGKKQFSKKSQKHSPFSKQSQMHSDRNSSELKVVNQLSTGIEKQKLLTKKSRKQRSETADIEPIVIHEPIPMDNEPDVVQLSNKSRKSPFPTDHMSEESQQNDFETSDVQTSNDKVVEKDNKSTKSQPHAKKQPLHVDGPQPKKSRGRPCKKMHTDPKEDESAKGSDQETNEVDEDEVSKRNTTRKSKKKPTLIKYYASKEREIVTGTRHSTRTRRLPARPPSVSQLFEQMRLKNKVSVSRSREKKKAPSTSQALMKRGNLLDDIEEVAEIQDEVIIRPNEQSSQEDVPPRKKKRPNETEHSTSFCSSMLNGELGTLQSFNFHGVRIGTGCKSVKSQNLTAHYLPSFTNGRSFGCMTINPNSKKDSCRTTEEMWMLVMSGSADLIRNDEFHTMKTGTVAQMQINTKYKLRNNSDDPALIFFTQGGPKETT